MDKILLDNDHVSPLPALLSTLPCDLILLAEPLFEVVDRFLKCHGLRIRVLRQKWNTQDPTDSVSPQDRSLHKHRCDARQDIQVKALKGWMKVMSWSNPEGAEGAHSQMGIGP